MENIIVPIDFTEVSEAASEMAINLGHRLNTEVIYIHLLETTAREIHRVKSKNEFHRQILKEVAQKSKKIESYSKKAIDKYVKSESVLNYDRDYSTLLDFAIKNRVRLIIMGTHGASGTHELLVGSHTQMVARLSSIPVLIVKEGYFKEIKTMAFFSNFREQPGAGFKDAMTLARELGLNVHLVHINTPGKFTKNRDMLERMNDYYKRHSDIISDQDLFSSYNKEDGVMEYCEYYNIDMISIVASHKEGTPGIFNSSLSEKLINHLKLPILSLHD